MAFTNTKVDGFISPSPQTRHVGVIRSPGGNGHNIAARFAAHRKAVLHVVLVKGERANPAAASRGRLCVYNIAVDLSWLVCLVLSSKEENILDQ